MNLTDVKQHLAEQHDALKHPMRWGLALFGSPESMSAGCFNGARSSLESALMHDAPYMWSVFHGDGCPLTFDALKDNATFNKEMVSYTQPWNKFTGTPRTELWLKFLLGEHSPWKELVPFLAETDASYINQAGFVYKDLKTLPKKLWYNFLMAYRLPWEIPRAFGLWLELCRTQGLHPAYALYVALNFQLQSGAKDLQGPYDVIYPWSCLEETRYSAAGRFCLAKPKEINGACTPNVHNLWTTHETEEKSNKYFLEFNTEEKLMLPAITSMLEDMVKATEKVI